MTLFGRRERHERIEDLRVRLPIGPILRNAGPLGSQSLLIGVGILVLRTRAAAFRRCERDLDAVGEFGVLLPFCGNQVEQAKSTVALLRFVGVAVDEAGMAVDKTSITCPVSNVRDVSFTVAYHRVVTAWRY